MPPGEFGEVQDINYSMSAEEEEEASLLDEFLAGKRFDVLLDLHEDYEAPGFCMYSAEQSNHLIGGSIVSAIKKTASINGDDNADEDLDLPISEGLFGINPSWYEQGFSMYACFENAIHSLATRPAGGSPTHDTDDDPGPPPALTDQGLDRAPLLWRRYSFILTTRTSSPELAFTISSNSSAVISAPSRKRSSAAHGNT